MSRLSAIRCAAKCPWKRGDEGVGRQLRSGIETVTRLCKAPDRDGFQGTQKRSGTSRERDGVRVASGQPERASRSEKSAEDSRSHLESAIKRVTMWRCSSLVTVQPNSRSLQELAGFCRGGFDCLAKKICDIRVLRRQVRLAAFSVSLMWPVSFPVRAATDSAPLRSAVAPIGFEKLEGQGAAQDFLGPERVQTVYNAENFLSVMPEGGIISEIAYRLDGIQGQKVDTLTPPIEIRMSTTSSTAPFFPLLWDANVGSDVRTVFSGPVRIIAEPTPKGPSPFAVQIPLQTPFLYDPRKGNLLVDTTYSGSALGAIVVDTAGGAAGRNYGSLPILASERSDAYVMMITFTQIPEPGMLAYCAMFSLITIVICCSRGGGR